MHDDVGEYRSRHKGRDDTFVTKLITQTHSYVDAGVAGVVVPIRARGVEEHIVRVITRALLTRPQIEGRFWEAERGGLAVVGEIDCCTACTNYWVAFI